MNPRRGIAALVVMVCVSLAGAGRSALTSQAPKQKPYEPAVGQEGKDVVWVPTPQAVVDKMLEMAKVTPQDFVIDLGSGDGRTVITAARRGAKALGIEYNPDMVELSKRKAAEANLGAKANFMKADLFETDFSQATVITMFLLPSINMQLRPKLLDLRPGTRIVSNSFTMEDWEADATETVSDCGSNWCTALLWIVPAKVEGTWQMPQGELRLTQQFQMVTGTLGTAAVEGRLRGDELTFKAGGVDYRGRVNGNVIKGTTPGGAGWTATRRADNPRFGRWKLKSEAPPPASNVMTYEPHGDAGMKITIDAVNREGVKSQWWYTTTFDGKDAPITGNPGADSGSVKVITDRINEIVYKKNGKVTQVLTNVLSPDHSTIGIIYMRADGEGKTTGVSFATYERMP